MELVNETISRTYTETVLETSMITYTYTLLNGDIQGHVSACYKDENSDITLQLYSSDNISFRGNLNYMDIDTRLGNTVETMRDGIKSIFTELNN